MQYFASFVSILVKPQSKTLDVNQTRKAVCVVSKRTIKQVTQAYGDTIPHETRAGTVARNEMDTHADTCCAGPNWKLMETTN